MIHAVAGIDPGLVNTGVVRMIIHTDKRMVLIEPSVYVGIPADTIRTNFNGEDTVFVEAYRQRSHFSEDTEMLEGIRELMSKLPKKSKLLDNSGVKKIITEEMLHVLNLRKFPGAASNHQDVKSAARIMLLGMAKDPELNPILYQMLSIRGRWVFHQS